MQVLVCTPRLERFIEEQISEGRFSTAADVVEAALVRLMENAVEDDLDDADCDRALMANEQIDRGKGRSFDDVAAELRSKYAR